MNMTKKLAAFGFALLFVSMAGSYSAEYNIVSNSSLEIDSDKDGIPDGFHHASKKDIQGMYSGAIDTQIFHSGKQSWQFRHLKEKSWCMGYLNTAPSMVTSLSPTRF